MICELCDRDLRNFCDLKKDLSLKQQQLYGILELAPVYVASLKDDALDGEEITFVEALDDAVLEQGGLEAFTLISEANSDELQTSVATRKTRRKQLLDTTTDKEKLHCDECGIFLASNISLRRHVDRIHRQMRNYQCDSCPYSAFFKHSIEKHIVKHISTEFRDRFHCELCDFVSISPVNIVLHKKYEHGDKRKTFKCDFKDCTKSFSRPGQLTAHNRLTHQKIKDKICSSCKRAFSTCKTKTFFKPTLSLN